MGLSPYTLEKAKMFGFDQPYLEACPRPPSSLSFPLSA